MKHTKMRTLKNLVNLQSNTEINLITVSNRKKERGKQGNCTCNNSTENNQQTILSIHYKKCNTMNFKFMKHNFV